MATDNAAASASSATGIVGGKGNDQQHSILSSKVSRALEVRTDTPAMKAALEALANLPDYQDELFTVDSRSVRVAIEKDALQQAVLLQGELQALLETVVTLRQGVSETAAIAHRVSEAIQTNVMAASSSTVERSTTTGSPEPAPQSTTIPEASERTIEASENAPPIAHSMFAASPDDALEQEQKLAALLSDSFLRRDLALQRFEKISKFLEKFSLPAEDCQLLDNYGFEDVEASSSNANGIAFLAALERVRVIRRELGRTFGRMEMLHHQQEASAGDNRLGASSALRMMETMAQKQERAYERLYHWLQRFLNLHSHGTSGDPPATNEDRLDEALSNHFVRRALFALRSVPAFYSHLLELIAASRRAEETRRFLLALTSGYEGLPPIEMRAHDSVVYVGDMLAFCFRGFSVEADVARGLFNDKPEEEEQKEDGTLSQDEEDEAYLVEKPLSAADMLAHSMSGVARPLKSRIMQVLANLSRRSDGDDDDDDDGGVNDDLEEEGSVARSRLAQLYEICGLLLFYASALEKGVQKLKNQEGSNNPTEGDKDGAPSDEKFPLVVSIMECLGEATNAYEASLRVYGAMLEQLNVLTGDPEASLAHTMLVRLVSVRESSPGLGEDVACPLQYQKTLSLEWACDVLVEAALPCTKSLDDTVSLKQCIAVTSTVEIDPEIAKNLAEKVAATENSLINVLVEKETADVLDLSGLGSLSTAWKNFQGLRVEGMVMASHPGLTQPEVEVAMAEFYASLYSPPLPSLESSIKDPTMRKLARTKIAANVCLTYEELYGAITSPDSGGYDDLSFLGHNPSQVKTLFSV